MGPSQLSEIGESVPEIAEMVKEELLRVPGLIP